MPTAKALNRQKSDLPAPDRFTITTAKATFSPSARLTMFRLAAFWLCASVFSVLAAEPAWTELAPNHLEAFKGKPTDWLFADSVSIDPTNPKKLVAVAGKGILVNAPKGIARDLYTKDSYGDVEVHLEFYLPKGSNSGIKFQGVYEVQICDSYGKAKVEGDDCGGIYPRAHLLPSYRHIDHGIAPKVNACKAPGEWQTLDIIFTAPRFNDQGTKTANAKIVKATLNGQVIHEQQEMQTPTGHNYTRPEVATGPIMLQGDHGPVAFRNLKLRPYGK
jgi:hypothetical protein